MGLIVMATAAEIGSRLPAASGDSLRFHQWLANIVSKANQLIAGGTLVCPAGWARSANDSRSESSESC